MPLQTLTPPSTRLWRADEFLEWLEPKTFADLINGQIYMHSPVNLRHARLLNFMDVLLRTYIRRKKLGELHRENIAVRLSSRNVFMPDLSFFTTEQKTRLAKTHAPFAPTFVLEALSPSSGERDLKDKFAIYEANDVQEYWILDPDELKHQFFRRQDEFFVEVMPQDGRVAAISIPGFWIKTAWLDPERLPDEDVCLREILGGQTA